MSALQSILQSKIIQKMKLFKQVPDRHTTGAIKVILIFLRWSIFKMILVLAEVSTKSGTSPCFEYYIRALEI